MDQRPDICDLADKIFIDLDGVELHGSQRPQQRIVWPVCPFCGKRHFFNGLCPGEGNGTEVSN